MNAVNDANPRATAQRARALVLINGTRTAGVISFEVDQNTFYQADTFRIALAISQQPVGLGMDYWSQLTDAEVRVFVGFPADAERPRLDELYPAVIGNIDHIELNPLADEILLLGRDLTAKLIDTKTVDQYVNKTSSEIATLLAAKHGLTPVVTATSAKAGGYYRDDHVSLMDSRPEWDLLTYLAEQEGFQVYVQGAELHFEPRAEPDTGSPYVISWSPPTADQPFPVSNALSVTFRRDLTLSRDVKVIVRSWNAKQRKGFTKTAERQRIRNRVITGRLKQTLPTQTYTFNFPNLTDQQAQERANDLANSISRHEMTMHAVLPGDSLLTPRTPIRVTSSGTAFDQTYYPASIVRRFTLDEGYIMDVEAKNHSPESQVLP